LFNYLDVLGPEATPFPNPLAATTPSTVLDPPSTGVGRNQV
jgi:hypothetical protein